MMSEELFPVTSLDEGQEAIVRLLSGGENLTGRLAAMGIIPGTRIKLLRKSRGQIIVLASDAALRERMGMAGRRQFLDKYTLEKFHARMDHCFATV